jgi:hypothetical protein
MLSIPALTRGDGSYMLLRFVDMEDAPCAPTLT